MLQEHQSRPLWARELKLQMNVIIADFVVSCPLWRVN